jgi:ketosteroid isomerase-like protein
MKRSVMIFVAVLGIAMLAQGSARADGEENQIRKLLDQYNAAIGAQDLNQITSCYVAEPSLVVFDVAPPPVINGANGLRRQWKNAFQALPGKWRVRETNFEIERDGRLAVGYGVTQISIQDRKGNRGRQFSRRLTMSFRKRAGQWLITHSHTSVPVDLTSGRAAMGDSY